MKCFPKLCHFKPKKTLFSHLAVCNGLLECSVQCTNFFHKSNFTYSIDVYKMQLFHWHCTDASEAIASIFSLCTSSILFLLLILTYLNISIDYSEIFKFYTSLLNYQTVINQYVLILIYLLLLLQLPLPPTKMLST